MGGGFDQSVVGLEDENSNSWWSLQMFVPTTIAKMIIADLNLFETKESNVLSVVGTIKFDAEAKVVDQGGNTLEVQTE